MKCKRARYELKKKDKFHNIMLAIFELIIEWINNYSQNRKLKQLGLSNHDDTKHKIHTKEVGKNFTWA